VRVQVLMSDLFGLAGTELLDRLQLPAEYAARVASLRRLIEDLDFEIDLFTGLVRGRLVTDPGYLAVQQIPGIGPALAAVFVAEIGEVTRFSSAAKLTCWAGMTPKHHESDSHVHRAAITKQGSRLVRWAAVESVKTRAQDQPGRTGPGTSREPAWPQRRCGSRRPRPAGVCVLRAARRRGPCPSTPTEGERRDRSLPAVQSRQIPRTARVVQVMTPMHHRRGRAF